MTRTRFRPFVGPESSTGARRLDVDCARAWGYVRPGTNRFENLCVCVGRCRRGRTVGRTEKEGEGTGHRKELEEFTV